MSVGLSTRRQRFAFARLPGPHLTHSGCAFSATLTTPALDRRSLRWFGTSPCRAIPGGRSPISGTASIGWQRSPTSSPSSRSWHTHIPCGVGRPPGMLGSRQRSVVAQSTASPQRRRAVVLRTFARSRIRLCHLFSLLLAPGQARTCCELDTRRPHRARSEPSGHLQGALVRGPRSRESAVGFCST